jgi:DNA replication protein DnaC
MKEKDICTEMPQNSPSSVPEFPEFKTLQDPVLKKMVQSAARFEIEFSALSDPRWLSFLGNSGTGKTMISKTLYGRAMGVERLTTHPQLICGVAKTFWPKLVSDLRAQKYWLLDDLVDANFVFIDEIAVEHDPSGFAKDKLCELLSRRVGKWTLITSNLNLEKLSEIDARISSRMIRGKSVVCECDTTDYFLRR